MKYARQTGAVISKEAPKPPDKDSLKAFISFMFERALNNGLAALMFHVKHVLVSI